MALDQAMKAALFARFGRVSAVATYRKALQRPVELLTQDLANYPPPSGKPATFVSDRQRRYVMMAIRSGLITVPYRRTMNLARSWAVDWGESSNLGRFEISNSATSPTGLRYAELVMGNLQTEYHRGTWPLVSQVFGLHQQRLEDAAFFAAEDALG